MIIERILDEAEHYLRGTKIKDVVLGISLIGVELDNGHIGLSYVLREELPPGCSVFGFAQSLIGQSGNDVARLAGAGENALQRAVGMAVLTAGSRAIPLKDEAGDFFGIEIRETDIVGMIGLIPPIYKRIKEIAKETIVFDKGISKSDHGNKLVEPMENQEAGLKASDVLIITGTTLINGTLEGILKHASSAREIVLVGSSTPMYPKAFQGTGITVLAGSWWNEEMKNEIFKKISLAGGISHLQQGMIKKAVLVNEVV